MCQIQTHAPQQSSKPVDHPDRETVEVRQGTGPRATVTVLIVSLNTSRAGSWLNASGKLPIAANVLRCSTSQSRSTKRSPERNLLYLRSTSTW
jgi:hypothetical protein